MRLTVRNSAASGYVLVRAFWSCVTTVDRPGKWRKFLNAALPSGSREPTSLDRGLVRLSTLFRTVACAYAPAGCSVDIEPFRSQPVISFLHSCAGSTRRVGISWIAGTWVLRPVPRPLFRSRKHVHHDQCGAWSALGQPGPGDVGVRTGRRPRRRVVAAHSLGSCRASRADRRPVQTTGSNHRYQRQLVVIVRLARSRLGESPPSGGSRPSDEPATPHDDHRHQGAGEAHRDTESDVQLLGCYGLAASGRPSRYSRGAED
jgi:hypothetical protein